MSLIEVKLRPTGPWRVGDRAGDRERVDVVYHSDALYSAVTHAMHALGWLEEWLGATARAAGDPAVRLSSLFPFVGRTRLVAPPLSVWPPAATSKLYLQAAKLIPLEILKSGVVEESRWQVDGESGCMLPMGVGAPFRVSLRSAAAVDRVTGATEPHRTACLEFSSNAGWWGVFDVSDPLWEARVKSALRLLADSGFGGERSRGWGRASEPQFSEAAHLFASAGADGLWWLLSLYSPHETDAVDWSRGEFTATLRGGWTESVAGTGAKKQVRMIAEGSVLAAAALRGQAVDVAPDGFPHPVYRAGFALALPAVSEIIVRAVETTRPPKPAPVTAVPEPEGSGGAPSEPTEAAEPTEESAPVFEAELSIEKPSEAVLPEVAVPIAETESEPEGWGEGHSESTETAVAAEESVPFLEAEAAAGEPSEDVLPEVSAPDAEPESVPEPEGPGEAVSAPAGPEAVPSESAEDAAAEDSTHTPAKPDEAAE